MVRRTLDGMAAGGLYDVVGGGFHRYSVDARWVVPHFEKMLYDNALLTSAYLHAWVVTGEERYRVVVEETVDVPPARDARSRAAASRRRRTRTRTGSKGSRTPGRRSEWEALGLDPSLLEPFEHGREIVRGELDAETKARLLTIRAERPQPFRDDKAIASWNGLTLAALAEAARRLDRADWLDAARRSASSCSGRSAATTVACCGASGTGGSAGAASSTTTRTSRTGCSSCTSRPATPAGCSRHAGSPTSPSSSSRTTSAAASSSRRTTARRSRRGRRTSTTTRPRPGNSMLASVLVRLGPDLGRRGARRAGAGVLRLLAPAMERVPRAFAWALCALHLHLSPPRELAIVGDVRSEVARAALSGFQPRDRRGRRPVRGGAAPGRQGPRRRGPAVYVCERFACRAPVTRADELGR